MKFFLHTLIFFLVSCMGSPKVQDEKYREQAGRVTIIRDRWGVPHIYGKTDADAVFGLMYAQCEESFERVERNYLEVLGRMAELEGEAYLYQDMQMKIIYDEQAAKQEFQNAPDWLKKLLQAFADGINYYLLKHPEIKPAVLKKFEPWFPLLFTDGAYVATNTGGLTAEDFKNLYDKNNLFSRATDFSKPKVKETAGSNGFAIGSSRSGGKSTLLYINPHVSFYFRMEAHVSSEEGLNAYGAVTWGQFFIYQGFNQHCGWMHTSSKADAADLYAEKVSKQGDKYFYEYDGLQKPVEQKKILIATRKGSGIMHDSLTVFYTHHGPVMGSRNGRWLSLKAQNRSINTLIQSWSRMKVNGLTGFKKVLDIRANASTNTMYADDSGNIAYWHGNFVPRRNEKYQWNLPVDGTITATEWLGLHEVNELVHTENPAQGWIQNCNSSPFSLSGQGSIEKSKYAAYLAPEGDNFRSLRAIALLERENDFTIEKLVATGYDHYLAIFDSLLPPLFAAYDELPLVHPFKNRLQEPIAFLHSWDKKSSVSSEATTLAVFWAYQLISDGQKPGENEEDHLRLIRSVINNTTAQQKIEILQSVVAGLQQLTGNWKIPWGEINRYQRQNGDVNPRFSDNSTSLPSGLASAFLGSLPSYETVWQKNKKQYGMAGNSFSAAVEFIKGKSPGESRVVAKSIVPGGQSFNPSSKHFMDQASMYLEGKFKDVFFYKDDVLKNAEQTYHPGQEK
jgi:acyl-homoserine-lactone acylase